MKFFLICLSLNLISLKSAKWPILPERLKVTFQLPNRPTQTDEMDENVVYTRSAVHVDKWTVIHVRGGLVADFGHLKEMTSSSAENFVKTVHKKHGQNV